jgi:hypothetical protein
MAWQAFHKAFYKKGKLDVHPGLQRFLAVNGETDGAMQATAPIYIGDHINADEVSRVGDEIELLDEADAFVPNNPYIAYRKGETYFNAQRYKDALLYLQAAKPRMKSYHEVYSCECMPYECNRCLAGNQGGS